MSFKPRHIEDVVEQSMTEGINKYILNDNNIKVPHINKLANNIKIFFKKIIIAIKTMSNPVYWTKPNMVEAWGFATKIAIIFPGLLFGKQFWWLYIFAIISSIALIWSSTIKTLPTIIIFNVLWVILASVAILKHFL